MPRIIRVYTNAIRRKTVNGLLGKELTLEYRETACGYELRLIDMHRRLPYGWWTAERVNHRDFKLTR